jgi:type IV pilus assembly protein PilA
VQSIKSFISRRRDSEEGFTLIELMVVVLIIAILIAIAIPQFLGARSRAQDSGAKSDIRNGLTAEKTFYTDGQKYTIDITPATGLKGIEPSLNWKAAPSSVQGELGVAISTDTLSVCLQEVSKSGTTFSVLDISQGSTAGTYYAKGVCPSTVPGSGGAVPTTPVAFTTNGWG